MIPGHQRPLGFSLLAICLASTSPAAGFLLDAVAQAPALAAARQRVTAATARTDSAGRLADPEIEGMASRANGEIDRTMWELTVRQPLPKRGERAADRDRAQAAVSMAEADFAELASEIAADVAMGLAESDGAEARVRVLETQLSRMASVLQSLDARIASGAMNRIADRLTVQSRIAAMQLMIEQERRVAGDAVAEVRGRLGLAPDAPLPPFAAPSALDVLPDESPVLRASSAREAGADAMAKMARASAKPMTSVGLRLEREQSRMGNDETIGVAFMSEIPWRSRRYARADVRAADAERAAARADGDSARYRISTALSRAERAERLAGTARRLAADTRTRLGAEFDAFLRTAGTEAAGESSVLQAVEILEKTTDTELQIIQAETAARAAQAELWRYVPAERFLPGAAFRGASGPPQTNP